MKKITVILPMFELTPDVQRAVKSIGSQDISEQLEIKIADLRKTGSGEMPAENCILEDIRKDGGCDVELLTEPGMPHEILNRAVECAQGEYMLFLPQNCILTKDVLGILYARGVEKQADILIGNCGKQKGKKIQKSETVESLFHGNESENLVNEKKALAEASSLYNKLYRTALIREHRVKFTKFRSARKPDFVQQAVDGSRKIYAINREIYICDYKPIREYATKPPMERGVAFARRTLRKAKKAITQK